MTMPVYMLLSMVMGLCTRHCLGITVDGIVLRARMVLGITRISEWKCANRLVSNMQVGQGNCVLAGHNGSRHGTFFTNLKTIQTGEVVKLTDKEGNVYFYEVESMEVVGPYDNSVKDQGEKAELTLITCENNGTMRLIVKCSMQEVVE